jgi:glycerophosphoryl diester phosphodiesterase
MLSEATDDWKMDPFFIEANFFTDTVLLCLAKHISTRPILLSSFSPEICTLVALKQARWPVVFLTDAGNWQPTEVRATNLQEGVRFAKKWDLDGLALAAVGNLGRGYTEPELTLRTESASVS